MNDDVLDHYDVTATELMELVDKQLRFGPHDAYLYILRRHGHEFEDVSQTVLGHLIRKRGDYDPEKGSLATFIRINTHRKLQHMVKNESTHKRRAHMHTHNVSIRNDSPAELIHVFGITPDPADEIRLDHIEAILYGTYPRDLVDIFLESTVQGYTIMECVARSPYNYNKLQRTFMKMRKTIHDTLYAEA